MEIGPSTIIKTPRPGVVHHTRAFMEHFLKNKVEELAGHGSREIIPFCERHRNYIITVSYDKTRRPRKVPIEEYALAWAYRFEVEDLILALGCRVKNVQNAKNLANEISASVGDDRRY